MNAAQKILGNLILVTLISLLADVPMPWSAFDLNASDLTTLVTTSAIGWSVSLTIGWAKVWYGIGYVISETPWYMFLFSFGE